MLSIVTPTTPGPQYFENFRRLAETGKVSSKAKTIGHKDGWGIIRINENPTELEHRALQNDGSIEANAATSKSYTQIITDIEKKKLKNIFLAHIRRATIDKKHVHSPFIENNCEFYSDKNLFRLF